VFALVVLGLLVAVGGPGLPRVELAADRARSTDATLIETAAARFRQRAGTEPERPSAAAQLVDLAFPFSLYEQAPLIGRGIPAVTFTTAAWRPPRPLTDSLDRIQGRRITQAGLAAEGVLGSLDEGVPLARDTSTYVYVGRRLVEGWAIKLVLISALLPFLLAAVDLFARCRRRRIPLTPAFRSYRSRLGFWLWAAVAFGALALLGAWTHGASRPPPPDVAAVGRWPVFALVVLGLLVAAGWFVTRERLIPRRAVAVDEELAGQTAALLVLGVVAIAVAAAVRLLASPRSEGPSRATA